VRAERTKQTGREEMETVTQHFGLVGMGVRAQRRQHRDNVVTRFEGKRAQYAPARPVATAILFAPTASQARCATVPMVHQCAAVLRSSCADRFNDDSAGRAFPCYGDRDVRCCLESFRWRLVLLPPRARMSSGVSADCQGTCCTVRG